MLLAAADVPVEVIADLLGHEGLQLARSVYIEPRNGPARVPMEAITELLNVT